TVAACISGLGSSNLVVDPVLVSKHGDTLLADDAVGALKSQLIPLATVVTPNLPEASRLVGIEVDSREAMIEAGTRLVEMGARVALVKGGHLGGAESPDCLVSLEDGVSWLEAGRIPGRHTHGTGCVLSAAIAAELARGMDPADACVAAKRFLEHAIASGLDLGSGVGPVNPGWGRQA
ncbi:MAG: hydroxymethylpyrimidine/phosphomethylpyrimidine kinase, partial [Actinobacteria bacterium]|nr:hydroxymethylpyrimidine/phosphomethylpyrimidine kinase [Actinomycetota bacterium]